MVCLLLSLRRPLLLLLVLLLLILLLVRLLLLLLLLVCLWAGTLYLTLILTLKIPAGSIRPLLLLRVLL